jgi:hypothetical protein
MVLLPHETFSERESSNSMQTDRYHFWQGLPTLLRAYQRAERSAMNSAHRGIAANRVSQMLQVSGLKIAEIPQAFLNETLLGVIKSSRFRGGQILQNEYQQLFQ